MTRAYALSKPAPHASGRCKAMVVRRVVLEAWCSAITACSVQRRLSLYCMRVLSAPWRLGQVMGKGVPAQAACCHHAQTPCVYKLLTLHVRLGCKADRVYHMYRASDLSCHTNTMYSAPPGVWWVCLVCHPVWCTLLLTLLVQAALPVVGKGLPASLL